MNAQMSSTTVGRSSTNLTVEHPTKLKEGENQGLLEAYRLSHCSSIEKYTPLSGQAIGRSKYFAVSYRLVSPYRSEGGVELDMIPRCHELNDKECGTRNDARAATVADGKRRTHGARGGP